MLASPFDVSAIYQILGVISQSLHLVVSVTGLICALLWLRDTGSSAKFAAAGFGLQTLAYLGSFAEEFLFTESGWTYYTPYSTESDSGVWLSVGWFALQICVFLLGTSFVLIALVAAWRRNWRLAGARD